ncbi:GIY-YIG nuclease family protein [Candidatus Nomurabacteria bacterium]|nr:GIY-YIG nuclease family protein [Candidatus Nomurabacteria bacterium]USN94636.1 MAG: GIY-YIG nuclease family protein [Candidatus Nomurabacteria bacterium]
MYYVYILQSTKNSNLYKGVTSDLKRRLREHNLGNVKSTKPHKPWKLIYYQGFTSKIDAESEEKFLKTGKGRERIKYLLKDTLKN